MIVVVAGGASDENNEMPKLYMHCNVLNPGVQQTLNEELIYLFLRSPDINKA